jgi:hypothetical protein
MALAALWLCEAPAQAANVGAQGLSPIRVVNRLPMSSISPFRLKAGSSGSFNLEGLRGAIVSPAAKGFNDLFEKTSPTVSGSIATSRKEAEGQGAATNH